jgi:N-acetylglutamate synthase/N-acetylornithine aminotransferase
VPLRVDLGSGSARTVVLSSDLGHDYVRLNADYRS